MRFLFTSAGVACATILALCFAALSAAYWITELKGQPDWQVNLAVTASVCVSLMGPACAYLVRSYSWLLVIPALVFVGCDIYQNAHGYQVFRGLSASADIEAAQSRLDQARADLTALPMPSATGQIRQASTWETLNTALTGRVEKAEAELTALEKPQTQLAYVAAVTALVQIALTLTFGCLGKPKQKAERPAPKAKSKKRSQAAKKGWEKRKAKQAVQGLRVVAAND
jgi:hypothetical protein